MPEKNSDNWAYLVEFFRQVLPYITTLALSCWGGTVSYIQRMRQSRRKFNLKELMFDLVISSFAGLLTHFFCEYAKVDGAMSAILIAVSGHMGTRAIAGFEVMRDRIFNVSPQGVHNDKQP